MTRVVAIDISITATGVALPNGALTTWTPTVAGDMRLVELADRTNALAANEHPDLAVIEDALFTGRANRNTGIVLMAHGVIRTAFLRRNIPIVYVPPATLKIYACGTGQATKHDMMIELYKRTGLDVRDDNQADAWWLRAMGCAGLGAPVLELPKTHTRALDKIRWPVMA